MAIKIDNDLLQELGLASLPEAEKNGLLKHIYETLEMRVGMRLADQMTNEQLDEFEQYFDAKDDAGAFKWLESNFPNYKDIVQEEFDKLKVEVGQSAPQILSASQQPPVAAQPVAPQLQPMDPNQYPQQYQAQPQSQMPVYQPVAAPQPQMQPPYQQPQQPYYEQPAAQPQPAAPAMPDPYQQPQPQPPMPPQTPQPPQPPAQPWQPPQPPQSPQQ